LAKTLVKQLDHHFFATPTTLSRHLDLFPVNYPSGSMPFRDPSPVAVLEEWNQVLS
jgi:hypothetical protein